MANFPPHRSEEWNALNYYRNLLYADDDTRSIASTSVSKARRKPGELSSVINLLIT